MIEKHLVDGIEVYCFKPAIANAKPPLLFVHGAYTGAWSWLDYYMPWFEEQGYRCFALSLRGHGGSERKSMVQWHTISDYVDDVISVLDWMTETPVLIGHSLGGFVVQKVLERRYAKGAVLMCSAPPQGLMAGQFHLMFKKPATLIDLNQLLESGQPTPHVLRDALFAEPIGEIEVNRYLMRLQPESQRAIWEVSIFHEAGLAKLERPPMLILGAEKDAIISPFLIQSTAQTYGLPHRIFRGMGHALTHEKSWQRVTSAIHDWLKQEVQP